MNDPKRGELLREEQPFGHVHETPMHRATFANKAPIRNDVGPINEVGNNGRDHAPRTIDHSLGAGERANAFKDQILSHWTGRPKGSV